MRTVLLHIHPSAVSFWQRMGPCWPMGPMRIVGTFSQTTDCTTPTRQHTTGAYWCGKKGRRRRTSPSTTTSVEEKVSENRNVKKEKKCSQRKNSIGHNLCPSVPRLHQVLSQHAGLATASRTCCIVARGVSVSLEDLQRRQPNMREEVSTRRQTEMYSLHLAAVLWHCFERLSADQYMVFKCIVLGCVQAGHRKGRPWTCELYTIQSDTIQGPPIFDDCLAQAWANSGLGAICGPLSLKILY